MARNDGSKENVPPNAINADGSALSRLAEFRKSDRVGTNHSVRAPSKVQIRKFRSDMRRTL
jgi:hypothetical protein